MSYEVTITERKTEAVVLPKQWKKIGQVEKEREMHLGDVEGEPKTIVVDEMGYSPETTTRQTTEEKIYERVVEELDIRRVILAVEGIDSAPGHDR